MPRRHEQSAPDHGEPRADESIREDAPEVRRGVDQRAVCAVDRICRIIACLKEALDEVEGQERAHSIKGEALPHLNEEQEE